MSYIDNQSALGNVKGINIKLPAYKSFSAEDLQKMDLQSLIIHQNILFSIISQMITQGALYGDYLSDEDELKFEEMRMYANKAVGDIIIARRRKLIEARNQHSNLDQAFSDMNKAKTVHKTNATNPGKTKKS